jgi:hypothetical protein
VFLLDVDNTLLDNDRFGADLGARLEGIRRLQRDRYWAIFAQLRDELAMPTTWPRCSRSASARRRSGPAAHVLVHPGYPFADRCIRARSKRSPTSHAGPAVVLSDGDVVFQPRKIQRSGIWDAGRRARADLLHKERSLDAMQRRYPASHYVMVDDKALLLAAMKRALGEKLTTVFVRQGHYATSRLPPHADRPAARLVIERIGDLLDHDLSDFSPPSPARRQHQSEHERDATLHDLGQSLWLDNITREMLDNGTLRRYIDEFSITGLTSNPDDLRRGDRRHRAYDAGHPCKRGGKSGEALFSSSRSTTCAVPPTSFRPVFDRDRRRRRLGVDGSVAAARDDTSAASTPREHSPRRRGQSVRQDSRHAPRAFPRSRSRSSTACRST